MTTGNIPTPVTAFVGRSGELAEIAARLRDPACRLLTLVGPGGIGKTRLALEAVQQVSHPDDVCFVPLQPLTSSELIVPAISESLHLSFYGEQDIRTQLLTYLRTKHLLLVLDNFEHLLDGADLLLEILEIAPEVKLLVTSRERLRLREEWVLDVRGLPFPEQAYEAVADDYDAVQLFTQSTQRIGSALRTEDTPHIVHICKLVGGIPLAIELAAAWTRALSCQQISHELERSLDILEASFRNAEPRHRNMRTAFEPTWQRLTNDEQDVFMRLSVFRGGFTAEAAEQVAGASLRNLYTLVDKSLLRLHENGRCDLHDLLRQYGEEKLEAAGLGDHVRDAHSAYYASYVSQRNEDMKGRRQLEALKEIGVDFENVRIAWRWAAARRLEDYVSRMLEGVWLFCKLRSRYQDRQAFFRYAAQQYAPEPPHLPSRIWGRLAARAVDETKSSHIELETALQVAHHHEDVAEIALCLNQQALRVYLKQDPHKAQQLLEQSLLYYRRLGDLFYVANAMTDYNLNWFYGSWDKMAAAAEEALRLHREIGDKIGMAMALFARAVGAARVGDYAECERRWRERIDLGNEADSPELVALGYAHLSTQVYFVLGDFDKTRAAAEEVFKFNSVIGPHISNATGWALAALGLLASMNEHYQEGETLCRQIYPGEVSDYVAVYAAWGIAIAACGLEDYDTAASSFALGLDISAIQGTVGIILCLPVAAVLLAHQGSRVRAVEMLALAFTHPVRAFGWMEKWPLLARLRAELEQTLGSDVYAAAWERGTLLDANDMAIVLRQQYPAVPLAPKEKDGESLIEALTEREREVLGLIANGFSNRAIADQLILSVGTVKWYTTQIYGKLSVENRAQAVRRAQQLNLFS